MWGKLSINQINVILNKAEEQKRLKFEQVFFEEFDKNILNTFNLKFVSISEEFEDHPAYFGQATSSMVIRLINDANQHFKIKTNNKKIVSLFEGEKEGVWFRVSGYIKYISDNNKYVNLTSRGIKIEEIVK